MPSDPIGEYTVRVSSGHPGTEVSVVGALYLGGTDGDLRLLQQRTPFEVSGRARILSGMLRAADPDAHVSVEVLRGDVPGSLERVSMARGRTVLLGERVTAAASRFIRTAP